MVPRARGPAGRRTAVHACRHCSAPARAKRGLPAPQALRCGTAVRAIDRRGHGCAGSSRPPLCPWRCSAGNPDASLSVLGACASCSGARRADTLPGSCVGSVDPHAATPRAGGSPHTLPHSSGCPGRSPGRCAPAAHSARSCRADSSPRLPPCTPHAALDNAVQCRHKGNASAQPKRASTQKARGSFQECARAFAFPAFGLRIAHSAPDTGQAGAVGQIAASIPHRVRFSSANPA